MSCKYFCDKCKKEKDDKALQPVCVRVGRRQEGCLFAIDLCKDCMKAFRDYLEVWGKDGAGDGQ